MSTPIATSMVVPVAQYNMIAPVTVLGLRLGVIIIGTEVTGALKVRSRESECRDGLRTRGCGWRCDWEGWGGMG